MACGLRLSRRQILLHGTPAMSEPLTATIPFGMIHRKPKPLPEVEVDSIRVMDADVYRSLRGLAHAFMANRHKRHEFAIGDSVRLKSGGLIMQVDDTMIELGHVRYRCSWTDAAGHTRFSDHRQCDLMQAIETNELCL
jgi:uncharacterized protein YodC (DUF2158 family)